MPQAILGVAAGLVGLGLLAAVFVGIVRDRRRRVTMEEAEHAVRSARLMARARRPWREHIEPDGEEVDGQ